MNSNFERARGFATLSDYPTGLMNLCKCGQVVLAPKTEHDECSKCDKHTPHLESISTIVHDSEYVTKHTFCESCEENIDCFSFYDDDRGIVWTKWSVTK